MKSRLDVLTEQHGPIVAQHLHALEVQAHRAEALRLKALNDKLAQLRGTLEHERLVQDERLQSLRREMDEAGVAWNLACQRHEEARRANQSALVPLQNRIYELMRELNRSPHEGRVEQWVPVKPEDVPQFREGPM